MIDFNIFLESLSIIELSDQARKKEALSVLAEISIRYHNKAQLDFFSPISICGISTINQPTVISYITT